MTTIKEDIKKQLIDAIKTELANAMQAYSSASDLTKDSEFKQEGKYDTRSIEAGYLAGAHKVRVDELEQELNVIQELNVQESKKTASIGSLITLKTNETESTYFISPITGGKILSIANTNIMVISAFSPLGNEVLDLEVGDEFEVTTPRNTKTYELISIE